MSREFTQNVVYALTSATEALQWWAEQGHQYTDIVNKFKEAGFECALSTTGIDVSGSGDREMLIKAFRILRSHGYDRSGRPGPKDTYFSGYFRHENLKDIWFSFSSTVCQRVQVGTEMREVPVYDIQCSNGGMEISDEELGND